MAQKNKEDEPRQEVGRAPEGSPQGDEFEDAVTTEISDVLARAFDEDRDADLGDVYVTDMQLTARIDPEADDALLPGFLLNDRFEIVELVHSGGMSLVYKAIDLRRRPEGAGEIHVAIKMMRPSVASHDEARLSLQREAAQAQSLSHPNIINIFDFDDHDGQFFLVMEWLEGESVNALLRRTSGERLSPDYAWTVIEGAAAGVRYAHQKNVVHADINPSNVFITDKQEIKLLDFGVARSTSDPDNLDDDRFAWVTQSYASPQVLSGLMPVYEDDVFSLACVAYRLLSGKHPFGGTLSLVAKHRGISVEPIPGLPENQWQILRRALSYEQTDRPGDVGELIVRRADAAGIDGSLGQRIVRAVSMLRAPLAAAAVIVIMAGVLWLVQRGDVETVPLVEPAVPEPSEATDTIEAPAISAADALVADAVEALSEGRLVAPDESNARALLREALVLEPDNAEALRGLRSISNDFLQQAHEALNSDDPVVAYAALAVASETDSVNPAIEIVSQLFVTKGDGELADARLAAATGNFDLAAERLSRAEQYSHIDPAEIRSVRRQIEQSQRSAQLTDSLVAADAHIAAGRLLLPEDNNAHGLLIDLHRRHGDDARLLATMERLGERLLTRAAFAAAAARLAEATDLLDAVEALGVLAPEVEAVRVSLGGLYDEAGTEDVQDVQVAEEQSATAIETEELQGVLVAEEQPGATVETEAAQDLQVAEERTGATAETEDVQGPQVAEQSDAAVEAGSAQFPPVIEEQSGDTLMASSAGESVLPMQASSETATTEAEPEPRRRTLQELGITRFVAPEWPRRAERRRVTGMVEIGFIINADGSTGGIQVLRSSPGEIFSDSATDAVRQWRFEPREEMMPAQVTLRFDVQR